MTWSEVGDVLHRWAAVFLFGIAFFRFAFQVAIWPNLLLLAAGSVVAAALRRRGIFWWVIGVALLMSGIWGLGVTFETGSWSDIVRPEPFGQVLLGVYILTGVIAQVVAYKKLHS